VLTKFTGVSILVTTVCNEHQQNTANRAEARQTYTDPKWVENRYGMQHASIKTVFREWQVNAARCRANTGVALYCKALTKPQNNPLLYNQLTLLNSFLQLHFW